MSTLRQFAYLAAVVEEESFSRAAARMHVAQPSLSQQVRALERELGGDLLVRLPRTVRLTAAGKALLPHATLALESAERGIRAARAALQLQAGELEISTVHSIASGVLPALIECWRRRHVGTLIRLHETSHRRAVEALVRDGRADVGIGPTPRDWAGPVEVLGWEEFVVVLPDGGAAAARGAIPLASLASREWVLFEPGHGLAETTIAACASASPPFVPRRAVTTSQGDAAARLAWAGVGPALVPASAVPAGVRGVAVEPRLGRELAVYARAPWSPLAAAFLALLRERHWPAVPEGAVSVG